jgi:hypothetical protein
MQALRKLIALAATLVSPAFTGTPTAPTAAPGTNTTQLATCAHVKAAADAAALVAPAAGALSADVAGRAMIAAGYFDAATAEDKIADAAIPLDKMASGYRAPAANAALVIATTDSVIKLQSTDATDLVATMTATRAGHVIDVFLDVCSSTGSYAFASNQGGVIGSVALAAAEDGVRLVYSGTAWEVVQLFGAAIWA